MSLDVAHLSCRRGGRLVIRALSFGLAPGQLRLLRGPNGAGKTTLLRTLAGLLPPAGGGASLDGLALGTDPDRWCERIAYAGHLDAIKPQLTVAENLAFWAALDGAASAGARRAAVAAALDAFGLAAIAGRPTHACSAGQRRRAGLARLVLAPRRLWLLDEPTGALDADAAARFAAVLSRHLGEGGMALVATHVAIGLDSGPPLELAPIDRAAATGAGEPDFEDPFLAGAIA